MKQPNSSAVHEPSRSGRAHTRSLSVSASHGLLSEDCGREVLVVSGGAVGSERFAPCGCAPDGGGQPHARTTPSIATSANGFLRVRKTERTVARLVIVEGAFVGLV